MSVGAAESEDLVVEEPTFKVYSSMSGKLALPVGRRSPSVPFVGFSTGLLYVITWQQSGISRDQGRSSPFYDLALKVTHHDIGHILLITHTSPDFCGRKPHKDMNMRK